jgi:hypothetical protein
VQILSDRLFDLLLVALAVPLATIPQVPRNRVVDYDHVGHDGLLGIHRVAQIPTW